MCCSTVVHENPIPFIILATWLKGHIINVIYCSEFTVSSQHTHSLLINNPKTQIFILCNGTSQTTWAFSVHQYLLLWLCTHSHNLKHNSSEHDIRSRSQPLYNNSSNDLHCQILVSPSGSRLFCKVITLTNLLYCEMNFSEFHMISQETQRDFMACMQLSTNIIKTVSVRTFFSLYFIYHYSCYLTLGCYGTSCCFAVHCSMNIFSTTFSLKFPSQENILREYQINIPCQSYVSFSFTPHRKTSHHQPKAHE